MVQYKVESLSNCNTSNVSTEHANAALTYVPRSEINPIKYNCKLVSFVYLWYTEAPWTKKRDTKPSQTLFSDMVTRLAILFITWNKPMLIEPPPTMSNTQEYDKWKSNILTISQSMAAAFNIVMETCDKKTATNKSSSIRIRFNSNKESIQLKPVLIEAARLFTTGLIKDNYTPVEYHKGLKLLEKIN